MKWGKTAAAVAAIGCGVLAGSMLTSFANSIPPAGQPGSAEDPVVTKSYVDEQIEKALSGGQTTTPTSGASEQTINALKAQIAALEATVQQLKEGNQNQNGVPFTLLTLKPGETLMGGVGTELILRAGKAAIYSNSDSGVPDLTDGMDLKNGTQAPKDHLLMIPREGRGLKVEAGAKGDAIVTVKGKFLHIGTDGNPIQ